MKQHADPVPAGDGTPEPRQGLPEQARAELAALVLGLLHELRAPLRALGFFSQRIAEASPSEPDEERAEYLKRSNRCIVQLNAFLDRMEKFALAMQMEPPDEDMETAALVGDALALLEGKIRQRGALIEVAAGLPRLRVNSAQATAAVVELLTNALKFTPEGQAPQIEIAPWATEGEAGLLVRDRGPGIPARHARYVFGMFKRLVGSSVEGNGVGLALVETIAQRHGGRAWVTSREAGGAEFGVTFGALEKCPDNGP